MNNTEKIEPAVGGFVLISNRHNAFLSRIDKVTKTQIICGDYRFNKQTMWLVGGDKWSVTRCQLISEERYNALMAEFDQKAKIRAARLYIQDNVRKCPSHPDLIKIAEMIKNMIEP
jgi:hypothetical protein